MSEVTENIEIDELLEKVALAMAKGDNQAATHLLPKIMATGDDVQRQMAESYLMQLDALIAMEEEEAKLSEFIDFNEGSEEGNVEVDLASEVDDESQDAIVATANSEVIDDITTAEAEIISDTDEDKIDEMIELDEVDSILDEVRSISPDNEVTTVETQSAEELSETQGVDRSQRMQAFDVTHNKGFDSSEMQYAVNRADETVEEDISVTGSEATEETADASDAFIGDIDGAIDTTTEITEDIRESTVAELEEIAVASDDDTADVDAIEASGDEVSEASEPLIYQELSAQEEQEKEYDIALEQAAMLIDDGEYSTAEMLLEAVFEGGGGMQLQMAEAYKMQIEQLSQMPEAGTPDTEVVTEPMQTMTEQDQLFDAMPEELSNAPVELIDFIDEPVGMSNTDDLFDVDNIFNDKPAVAEPNGSLENRAFRTQYGSANNEISSGTSVSEQFNEKENTEGLLSPTAALDSFAFSGEDLLPKGSTTITDEVVNQRQGFFVGDVGLMIDFIGGSELTEMPDYYAVPNAPSWLKGLTNLHGVIVPVFDLVQFLNLERKSDGKQMLLILQHHEKAVGVIVNGLPTRLSWRDSQRMEDNASPDNLSHYIDGAYLLNEQLWFDLDVDSLCAALERGLASAA